MTHLLNHDAISPTAKLVAYARQLSDIPFSKDVSELFQCQKAQRDLFPDMGLDGDNQIFATHLELRYKSIQDWLLKSPYRQVLEFASGIALRGLAMTKDQTFLYVETDLAQLNQEKTKLLNIIYERHGLQQHPNLFFYAANILNGDDLIPALKHFNPKAPVAIVHEGLFQYLNREEKTEAAKNIRHILQQFGGAWITPDLDTKSHSHGMHDFREKYQPLLHNIEQITGRNFEHNAFEDENDIKDFFKGLGFKVSWVPQFNQDIHLSTLKNIDEKMMDLMKKLRLWVLTLL